MLYLEAKGNDRIVLWVVRAVRVGSPFVNKKSSWCLGREIILLSPHVSGLKRGLMWGAVIMDYHSQSLSNRNARKDGDEWERDSPIGLET